MRPAAQLYPLFAGLVVSAGASACERAPAEDFAPKTSISAAAPPAVPTSAVGALPPVGRCVQPALSEPARPVHTGPAPGCPPDPEGAPGKLPVARITFADPNVGAVEAEVVRSEHDTMRGLMYRKSLGEDRGMLFDLRVRDDHKFWMHNTCIPLDLLYVDEDGLIVGIVENAPTLDDESRGVGCPSRYVLEVNAGWARRHGVRAGQKMTFSL
jgi:uncharacterized membrane protein (UPF0127 family)